MKDIIEGISPLPWGWANLGVVKSIRSSSGKCLAQTVSENFQQDAAYIVHACNLYPELVEALERIVAHINDYERINNLKPNPPRTECWDCVADAKALLAKCKAGAE